MSDIVADAKRWLEWRPPHRSSQDGRTHSDDCHRVHVDCLIARLVAEVERHRMTEEERASAEWWVNAEEACGYDMPLRNYLDRTATEAPAAGWLTDSERRAVAYFADVCRDDIVPDEWTVNAGVLRSLLARAGSLPVVEVPAMHEVREDLPWGRTACEEAQAYRDALDKAGVPWKEVSRE